MAEWQKVSNIDNPIWEYFLLHKSELKAKCTKCAKGGVVTTRYGTSTMRLHMRKKHKMDVKSNRRVIMGDLTCDLCGYKTSKASNMKMHRDAVHLKIRNFACGRCNYAALLKGDLQRHIKSVHDKIQDILCKHCDFKTGYAQHLRKHIKDNHEDGPRPNKKMTKRVEIRKMMEEGIEWRVIAAKMKCSKQLLYKVWGPTYKTKVRVFFNCNQCKYATNRRPYLDMHVKAIHDNIKDHECKQCDYKSSRMDHLESHVERIHNKKVNINCDECDYKAPTKYFLKRHMETSHDEKTELINQGKNNRCDKCEFTADNKSYLLRHIRAVHKKVKDLTCKGCNLKTAYLQHLRNHKCKLRVPTKHSLKRNNDFKYQKGVNEGQDSDIDGSENEQEADIKIDPECSPDQSGQTTISNKNGPTSIPVGFSFYKDDIGAIEDSEAAKEIEYVGQITKDSDSENLYSSEDEEEDDIDVGEETDRVKVTANDDDRAHESQDRASESEKLSDAAIAMFEQTENDDKSDNELTPVGPLKSQESIGNHIKPNQEEGQYGKFQLRKEEIPEKEDSWKRIAAMSEGSGQLLEKLKMAKNTTESKELSDQDVIKEEEVDINSTDNKQFDNEDVALTSKQSGKPTSINKMIFKCKQCGYVPDSLYNKRYNLEMHVKAVHDKIKDHECSQCDFKTSRANNLRGHVQRMHEKDRTISCGRCEFKADTKYILKLHLEVTHNEINDLQDREEDNKCDKCEFKTPSKSYLQMHMRAVHQKIKNLACNLCNFKTAYSQHLKCHIKANHEIAQSDNKDRKILSRNGKKDKSDDGKTQQWREVTDIDNPIWEYFLKHENGLKAKCTTCTNSIVGLNYGTSTMRIHMKKKHKIIVKTRRREIADDLICGSCGYKTNKISNMNIHANSVHLKFMNFSCKQCNYKTMVKAHLDRHVNVVHDKVKDLSCKQCNFKTAYAQHLRKHIKDNHEGVPHINKRMAKRLEISKMLDEGVDMEVIAAKLNCSKQLIYQVRGPTYKSKFSQKKQSLQKYWNICMQKEEFIESTVAKDENHVEENESGEERAQHLESDNEYDDYEYHTDNEHANDISVKGKKCHMCEVVVEDEKALTKHLMSAHVAGAIQI